MRTKQIFYPNNVDCGCLVILDYEEYCGIQELYDTEIRMCPKHSAVDALLEACKLAVEGYINIAEFDLIHVQHSEQTKDMIKKLEDAILKTKNKEKNNERISGE